MLDRTFFQVDCRLSLTPRFSAVLGRETEFQAVSTALGRAGKPLKRFAEFPAFFTVLKPGVDENAESKTK